MPTTKGNRDNSKDTGDAFSVLGSTLAGAGAGFMAIGSGGGGAPAQSQPVDLATYALPAVVILGLGYVAYRAVS